ncbi:hypothetical protein PENANT_c004G00505 [Penicillium antarcticum]|uniref:AB hydrolase-1 domain-containing protein n=1 Tax=Penicillium antarcticum TaxID=416450 RepID=A0A1V6QGL9_9EURO|nr:uncharacterized protein N7508_002418 [Penicillium antarcticum]KAJ5317910.1 hypothetical protein N7508_002418 [Penicillium antarcticum]OQD88363.1 hypothetical protein PENANT_c004G00505 [Penicillium antarcticum]
MSKPTFVFSLGAWMHPTVFDVVRTRLEALGFPSECPAHPSIGAEPPSMTLENDVSSFHSVLTAVADEGRDIVVVGHSYGGVVASSAVEGLAKSVRAANGKHGGVLRVVYLAAFALDKGQSLLELLGGDPLPWMKVEGDYVHAKGAGEVAWQDLTTEQREKWDSTVRHTSRAVFSGEATYEPWQDIPCAYIICEQDQALLPHIQESFALKICRPGQTHRLPASHSPFLSMPERLVDVFADCTSVKELSGVENWLSKFETGISEEEMYV